MYIFCLCKQNTYVDSDWKRFLIIFPNWKVFWPWNGAYIKACNEWHLVMVNFPAKTCIFFKIKCKQKLSLEDPHSSLKWSPPPKQKEGLLPAPMRRKPLPWNLQYPGHPPTSTILQSPYSFAQTVSPCVKLSPHSILEHSQSTIPSTPHRLPSSFNGFLAILPF